MRWGVAPTFAQDPTAAYERRPYDRVEQSQKPAEASSVTSPDDGTS